MALPDVVVVGAGVVGAACAYFAARAGLSVVVVDRGPVAGGATAVAAGAVLVSDKPPGPLLDLAVYSRRVWGELGAELGADRLGLERRGGLAVALTEAEWSRLAQLTRRQKDAGVEAVRVRADGLHDLEPRLADGLPGGVHYPGDLSVHPVRATGELLRASGAQVRCGVEVRGVRLNQGMRVNAVRTDAGDLPCGAVVNAAGVDAGRLTGSIGVPLPIRPRRGFALVTEALTETATGRQPIRHTVYTGGYADSVHGSGDDSRAATVVHCDPSGAAVIGASREYVGLDDSWSLTMLRTLAARAVALFPFLREAAVPGAYRGFRPDTPDHAPLIGPDPWLSGLFHACGHEGAGVALAPATGALIAAQLTGEDTAGERAPAGAPPSPPAPSFGAVPSPRPVPLVERDGNRTGSPGGQRARRGALDPYPFQPERFA